jgi:hypothetical protein
MLVKKKLFPKFKIMNIIEVKNLSKKFKEVDTVKEVSFGL